MLGAFQVSLTPAELVLLVGCAGLSAVVPTAPGFVGSLQLVYAPLFTAFGALQTLGVAVATGIQLGLFFPGTVAGDPEPAPARRPRGGYRSVVSETVAHGSAGRIAAAGFGGPTVKSRNAEGVILRTERQPSE